MQSITALFKSQYPLVLQCCACMLAALAACSDRCMYSTVHDTISHSVMEDAVPLLIPLSNTDDEAIVQLCVTALQAFPQDGPAGCDAHIARWWDAWEQENEHPEVLFEKRVRQMWMRSTFAWDHVQAPGLTNAQLVAKARNIIYRTATKGRKREREQQDAAKKLQSRFRGRLSRREMANSGEDSKRAELLAEAKKRQEAKEREVAMTKLQSKVRARQAKGRVKEQRSAVALQRVIRGRAAKKTVVEAKKLVLREEKRKVALGESVSLPAIVRQKKKKKKK
jgi:hypothetical protein